MGLDIKFVRAEYDAALATIQGLQSRSWENNGSYNTDALSATDASSVVAYQSAMKDIKDYLQRYNTQLQADLDTLKSIADNIEEADRPR
jgi:type VII secretion effector (TIGR04197 family)